MLQARRFGLALPLPAPADDQDDWKLLELERSILEEQAKANVHDDEVFRLQQIWTEEWLRLTKEARAGHLNMSEEEISKAIAELPETIEHSRLVDLQQPHVAKSDRLIREMWAIPAKSQEGRRAKVMIMLFCIGGQRWQGTDDDSDWDIELARHLMSELLGGPEANKLRALIDTEADNGGS